MRNKNIISKHLNSRFFKSIICNLASKNSFLKTKFNIYNEAINIGNIADLNINSEKCGDKTHFLVKEIADVFIVGKAGVCIDEKTKKIILIDDTKITQNFVKPIIAKSSIFIDEDFFVINLCGIYKGHKHYFHFFFDYFIPLFYFLKKFYDNRKIKIITRFSLSDFQQNCFDFIAKNFPNIEFVKINDNDKVYCKKLIFISAKKHFYDSDQNPEIKNIMVLFQQFFYDNFNIKAKSDKSFENIYISRYDAKIRKIINEENFLEKLQEYNFKTYQLAKLSFKEQIEIFSQAKIIIGSHGAGFSNLMFAKKETNLIEIFPSTFYDEGFVKLSKIMDINRIEIIEDNGDSKDNFLIKDENIERLMSFLKNFS